MTLLAGLAAAAEVEQVHIHVDGHRLPAYRAIPHGSGLFPAVLFLHGGRGGVVGGDPKESVAALARSGYVALAPLRLKQNTLGKEIEQTRAALQYLRNLQQVDPQRVAVVGFSRGGLLALIAAVQAAKLRAAVLMAPASGRGALARAVNRATPTTPPTLILVAKNDTRQADHVALAQQTERGLGERGAHTKLILYPPFGDQSADGHRLFFAVRSNYFKDIGAFLSQHLGHSQAE
jgi:dienelactone hydrolase